MGRSAVSQKGSAWRSPSRRRPSPAPHQPPSTRTAAAGTRTRSPFPPPVWPIEPWVGRAPRPANRLEGQSHERAIPQAFRTSRLVLGKRLEMRSMRGVRRTGNSGNIGSELLMKRG